MHFNAATEILNTLTQKSSSNNKDVQLTPQQLMNFVSQFSSQKINAQQMLRRHIFKSTVHTNTFSD